MYSSSFKVNTPGSLPVSTIGLKELAHELKLPLFNIKSFLETLYEHNYNLTDAQRLDFLEIANKETNRLLFLIEDIIDLESISYINSLMRDPFLISDLIVQVINSYKFTAKNKSITLLDKSSNCSDLVYGDPTLIGQVVNNLVGNALKYSFSGTRICIRARMFNSLNFSTLERQQRLNFSILDEGIGISRNELRLIHMGTACRKKTALSIKVKGSNLGLKIVTQILSLHGSRLTLLTTLNKGSIIGFSLISTSYKAGKGT